jgi:cobalt-zinc-cadmium efflux system outer membrane protein
VRLSSFGRLGLLAVALSFSQPHRATEPEQAVTWPQVAAAIDRHPLLQEATARADGAAGALTSAREFPNPTFGVAAGDAAARGGPGTRREWEYSVELPLDFLNSRRQRVGAAASAVEGAREEARVVRGEVVRELRRTFVAVAHDQAILEAKTELEGQVAHLAALVRRRAERGEGRPTEVPRVEIELEKLRAGVARARAAADAQRQRLSTWLGAPVSRVDADLSRTPKLPALPELLQRLAEGSPALRAGRARVAAAEQEASAERWDRLPKVSVGAARAEELDRQATTVTATVSLPIWNWNVGKIRQADAALAAERARLDAATRELTARAAEGWQGCSAGQASAVRFREEILPRAEASAKALGRAYELGETSLLDLIDARRTLLETRTEHLDLLLDMQNACGDLAALAEMELP